MYWRLPREHYQVSLTLTGEHFQLYWTHFSCNLLENVQGALSAVLETGHGGLSAVKGNDQEALKAVGKTVQRALSAVLETV